MRFDGLRGERVRASKQFDGRTFRNPEGKWVMQLGTVLPVLPEFILGARRRAPRAPLPLVKPHEHWLRPVETGLRATWLGHSTVLLELDGLRVLTDPVFGERASPFSFAGPRRFHPVPARLSDLPPLDAVIISHDHYDHLCAETARELAKMQVPIVTSLGVGAILEGYGVAPQQIHELDWHETFERRGLRISAAPSRHFSGRLASTGDSTLWSSWVIQSERRRIFFSGDTGLTDSFRDTGAKYGPFDLVMLEIGAFQKGFESIHLGPENALTVFEMLGAGTLLPVHWGTFDLASHQWDAPGEELVSLATERHLRIITPKLGEVVEPDRVEGPAPWWRLG